MTKKEIKSKIEFALSELYTRDMDLIRNKAEEEAISAQLVCYLKPLFDSWNVDFEYNRDGWDKKENSIGVRILPDIIIHHRTPNREERFAPKNNLIAIEVKGHWNTQDRNLDEVKLVDIKKRYGYQYVFRIELGSECGEVIEVSRII
ncbi:MAG: hypothetical protein PHR47_00105 [Candidatus Pacebacteria bacterium]|nr:hypothetical protein [Candidatus Paceibacterota bacterium]